MDRRRTRWHSVLGRLLRRGSAPARSAVAAAVAAAGAGTVGAEAPGSRDGGAGRPASPGGATGVHGGVVATRADSATASSTRRPADRGNRQLPDLPARLRAL